MKHITISILFLSVYIPLIGQSIDSTTFYSAKQNDTLSRILYKKGFYKNGVIKFEGWCKLDAVNRNEYPNLSQIDSLELQIGPWNYYNNKGQLLAKSYYSLDLSDTCYNTGFDNKGRISYEEKYIMKQPLPIGSGYNQKLTSVTLQEFTWIKQYTNGVPYFIKIFIKGKKSGEWLNYDRFGNVKKKRIYLEGRLISKIKN